MSEPRAMQRLCGLMRKAVQDYAMIQPGDRVMVRGAAPRSCHAAAVHRF